MGAPQTLESLRSRYHSVHSSDRHEVIRELGAMGVAEAARELIQLFEDCPWRESRFRILEALGNHHDWRTLEFLFHRALDASDLPLQEAAIRAIGQTGHPAAGRFLIHLMKSGAHPSLSPVIVGAIGGALAQTFSGNAGKLLLRELLALNEEGSEASTRLLRNQILALGELKEHGALPRLLSIASSNADSEIAAAALLSIGKLSRDPKEIQSLETRFSRDLFAHQLFRSVRSQIQFRSQWCLEDYLEHLFGNPASHPSLPRELHHFRPEDVKEGLKLFDPMENFERLCETLACLKFPDIARWYDELFDLDALSSPQQVQLLRSLSSHFGPELGPILERIQARTDGSAWVAWIECALLSLPSPDALVQEALESPRFRALDDTDRGEVVQALARYGLISLPSSADLARSGRLLEWILENEESLSVRARALRALGSLGLSPRAAIRFAQAHAASRELRPSILEFSRKCPGRRASSIVDEILRLSASEPSPSALLLRALAAQAHAPDWEATTLLLEEALDRASDTETRLEALRFLARHPKAEFLPEVLECLASPEPKHVLHAVIALKAFGAESSAERLAPLLDSPDDSIAGRTLDTLTALPGLKPRRIVLGFLKRKVQDVEICGKIIRSLTPHENFNEPFVILLDEILRKHPEHPCESGLRELRQRFAPPRNDCHRSAKIDSEIVLALPLFEALPEAARAALRAAEIPFRHPEVFDAAIDKSASVLQYCKALDLVLDQELGSRILAPLLQKQLSELQSQLYRFELSDPCPELHRVLRASGLERHFSAQDFPLHKVSHIAQAILSGRIADEAAKTLDGLRAWGVVLLLFGRKGAKPFALLPLRSSPSDEDVIALSKRLMALQEIRNPAAHRQTLTETTDLAPIRAEVLALINRVLRL